MKVIGVFIAFCASAILGIAAIVVGACGENGAFGDKINYSELTADNAREGLIVEGDIVYVWDIFADEVKRENGKVVTVGEYYTVVLPHSYTEEVPAFIGFYSTKSYELSTLETLRSTFESILIGKDDAEGTALHFRGRLKKLDGSRLECIGVSVSDFIEIFELGEEYKAENMMVPYVIESYNGGPYAVILIVGIVLTVIGAGGVLVLVLKDIGEDG